MNMDDLYRLLRTGHVQAQGIVDTVADPLLVLDSNLCVQNASRAFCETFKVDRVDTIGQHIYELGNGQWDIPDLRRLLTDVIPKASAIINYEVEHVFPDLGRRIMLLTARTLFHPDGVSHTMLLSIVDATDQHRRDVAKDMLFGELRHRMNNLLGVAQSIARQTKTEGLSTEEYRDKFLGRFGALIEAEDLAFTEQGEIGLKQLLDRILAPYIDGPDALLMAPGEPVDLSPRTVMSLGLVLHELATNAAKYGALAVAGGQIGVKWDVEDAGGRLRLEWKESGGPPVTPPVTTGYGTQLIRSTITYSLLGEVEPVYAPDGLRIVIVIPLGTAPPQQKSTRVQDHTDC
ncbi:MAG: PAS domain-containing protein [Mesorhizobium sp.]|nr:PAS domain-containing protein [Mesorhizobium sp.]